MQIEKFELNSLSELPALADTLLEKHKEERIFVFDGKMGAGKTTFIKALVAQMGSEDNVSSPTFAIVNEYGSLDYGDIYHFDFYRIEQPEEAMDFGIEEYLYSGNYCFLEWAERIEQLLPENFVLVKIEQGIENERIFSF